MKQLVLLLALAGTLAAAQTSTTPTTPKPATTTAKPASTAKSTTGTKTGSTTGTVHRAATATAIKLPPGVPPVKGLIKPASFVLRYQDFQVGTGPVAEPLKLYKVKYTGWLAADGKKFDSSDDHPNKEPIQFPQGRGRVIPGWDQGFEGMRIGGKRRLFIPYQLAYGAGGRPPVIPAKADLIFDVELVDVTEMPAQAAPPGRPMAPRPAAPGSAPNVAPGTAPVAPTGATPPPAAAKPATPASPSTAPSPAAPATATPPATPSAPPPADKPANPAQPQ
jgi:peptidylprolyl isomerase